MLVVPRFMFFLSFFSFLLSLLLSSVLAPEITNIWYLFFVTTRNRVPENDLCATAAMSFVQMGIFAPMIV